jgi:D-amino-acid dehydrogenase
VIDVDKTVEIEPAFAERRDELVGASYTSDDESGDALKYTQELARVCEKMGAAFLYGTQVTALGADRFSKKVHSVEIVGADGYQNLRARDIVVSLGCWSAPILRPCGMWLNIYPAKGYSVTIPIDKSNAAPVTSLTDDEYKLVYSNFGSRLRVAGTAELSGYSRDLNIGRCEAILRQVRKLFPRAGDFARATYWSGLRPTTPSNIPYVGRTRYRNLWLNTGHGTLGWTLGAGSGFRVANMIAANDGPVVA